MLIPAKHSPAARFCGSPAQGRCKALPLPSHRKQGSEETFHQNCSFFSQPVYPISAADIRFLIPSPVLRYLLFGSINILFWFATYMEPCNTIQSTAVFVHFGTYECVRFVNKVKCVRGRLNCWISRTFEIRRPVKPNRAARSVWWKGFHQCSSA